jgi:hypothetical protein
VIDMKDENFIWVAVAIFLAGTLAGTLTVCALLKVSIVLVTICACAEAAASAKNGRSNLRIGVSEELTAEVPISSPWYKCPQTEALCKNGTAVAGADFRL